MDVYIDSALFPGKCNACDIDQDSLIYIKFKERNSNRDLELRYGIFLCSKCYNLLGKAMRGE